MPMQSYSELLTVNYLQSKDLVSSLRHFGDLIDSSGKIQIQMDYSFLNVNVRDIVINHYKELGFQVAYVCDYLIFDFNKKNDKK